MFILYNAGYTFVKNKCEKRKNNTLLRNSVHFFLGVLTIKKVSTEEILVSVQETSVSTEET